MHKINTMCIRNEGYVISLIGLRNAVQKSMVIFLADILLDPDFFKAW